MAATCVALSCEWISSTSVPDDAFRQLRRFIFGNAKTGRRTAQRCLQPSRAQLVISSRAMFMMRTVLLAAIASPAAFAQTPTPTPPPAPVQSPEVHADRRVTFRLRAPNAKEVFVTREGAPRLAMQKDEDGVWSVTTDPLEPDFYGYSLVADGVRLLDSSNPLMKPN